MPDVYFTADLHLNHARIIELGGRPFGSVEEMNEVLVANWNATVKRGDTVYFLGDLGFFNSTEQATALVRSLNGQKFLIFGNHDKKQVERSEGWAWKGHYRRIKVAEQRIVLCHYAMVTWEGAHRGSWMLYGHSHGNLVEPPDKPRMDVGVDVHDYRPISFDEVRERLEPRCYVPVDHHGKGRDV